MYRKSKLKNSPKKFLIYFAVVIYFLILFFFLIYLFVFLLLFYFVIIVVALVNLVLSRITFCAMKYAASLNYSPQIIIQFSNKCHAPSIVYVIICFGILLKSFLRNVLFLQPVKTSENLTSIHLENTKGYRSEVF